MDFPGGIALLLLLTFCLAGSASAQTGPPVQPPDESLTNSPGVESLNTADSTALLTPETVRAASPTKTRSGGLFRKRSRDSAYVDTLGVGFFNKILAPVYPNPERAAALSFVLPGSGQIYNKKFAWLKVPIIYGLYGALIYNGETNRRSRNDFQVAYEASLIGATHQFTGSRFDTPERLRTNRDKLDKNFQLSYIGVGILHLVQTLEAYTTSHLLEFDMDESLTLTPVLLAPPRGAAMEAGGARLGVGATWRFGTSR